jgi:hypothetical protein
MNFHLIGIDFEAQHMPTLKTSLQISEDGIFRIAGGGVSSVLPLGSNVVDYRVTA